MPSILVKSAELNCVHLFLIPLPPPPTPISLFTITEAVDDYLPLMTRITLQYFLAILHAAIRTAASIVSGSLAMITFESNCRTFFTCNAIIRWTTTLVDILANGTVWWYLATTHGTAKFIWATTYVYTFPPGSLAGMTTCLIISGGHFL